MNVHVFLGPTLSVDAAREVWDVPRYLPPVRQGDVYRAALEAPLAIGIVDGYFDGVPAVWHKEILWAMARGVHVFGAASMGALRAAELADFGMRGVGEIYADYRGGTLGNDDEVAVLHGPAELGYPALTEALVNIRATVRQATGERIVDAAQASALVALARERHYRERGYPRLLADAAASGACDAAALDAFAAWLPHGKVDRKALDAVALLARMRDAAGELRTPLQVDYRFAHTQAWQQVVERHASASSAADDDAAALALEQLKLDGRWRDSARAARSRRPTHFWPVADDAQPDTALLSRARDMLRRRHGLWRGDDLALWMRANGLDRNGFDALLGGEANVLALLAPSAALDVCVVEELRASGEYARYLRRAERLRRELLASEGRLSSDPAPPLSELMAASGHDWPNDVGAYAASLGFADVEAFRRALLRRRRAERAVAAAGEGADVERPEGTRSADAEEKVDDADRG